MPRDHLEFTRLAIAGLSDDQAQRVAVALDTAIAFGVLEHLDGNASLQDQGALEAGFRTKLQRLRGMQ